MDRYVRHTKRTEVDGKFCAPVGRDGDVAETALGVAEVRCLPAVWRSPPGAPQKTNAQLAVGTVDPNDSWRSQPPSAVRRLLFDDQDVTTNIADAECHARSAAVVTPEIRTTVAAYSVRQNDSFRAIVDSLSARGLVVVNSHQACAADEENGRVDDDDLSSVCGQLECMSVLEGVIYGVRAGSGIRSFAAAALAAVGPHPNIVSYFSCWTDSRYHYVQTEFCPENLSAAADRMSGAAEFCIALEHVACALHHLHRVKGYAHNRVNRWNIYRTTDGCGHVVYKLSGFQAATVLRGRPEDETTTSADVRALCSTVLRLMRYSREWANDDGREARSLLSYLSFAVTCDGRLDALTVWQWCCSNHRQEC